MPSVKNPNTVGQNRQAARASKARKQTAKRLATAGKTRIEKHDMRRGARAGLMPTSGPNAALSSKKKRKLEKQMAHALKRKMEAQEEIEMKDAETPAKSKKELKQERDAAIEGLMQLDLS